MALTLPAIADAMSKIASGDFFCTAI